jgi:hypothetical protein
MAIERFSPTSTAGQRRLVVGGIALGIVEPRVVVADVAATFYPSTRGRSQIAARVMRKETRRRHDRRVFLAYEWRLHARRLGTDGHLQC